MESVCFRNIHNMSTKLINYFTLSAVCSHRRAYYYYAEAINRSDRFVAVPCPSYEEYTSGACGNNTDLAVQLAKAPYDKL